MLEIGDFFHWMLLNKDKRVFEIWNLESESENKIKLKQEDSFGNIDYIVVYKKKG